MAKYRLVTEDALGDPESDARAAVDAAIAERVPVQVVAVGGSTDADTDALNAAIGTANGRTIAPRGTFRINANYAGGKGIRLNQPGTRLDLSEAVIEVIPNNLANYAAITITAADCAVINPTIVGDVGSHTGSTGEWGHGIEVLNGADRFLIQRPHISKCWGDGIRVATDGEDGRIVEPVCDDNRRQGISIVSATRLKIAEPTLQNTGLTAFTAPGAGLAVEPNAANPTQKVIDLQVIGGTLRGNAGRGFYAMSSGGAEATGKLTGVVAFENAYEGFVTSNDAGVSFKLDNCHAKENANNGFFLRGKGNSATGCTATGNTGRGFQIQDGAKSKACEAEDNGDCGFLLLGTAPSVTAPIARGNNKTTTYYGQIAVDTGVDARIVGALSFVGDNASKPTKGFEVKAGSTGTKIISSDPVGSFSSASLLDNGTGTLVAGTDPSSTTIEFGTNDLSSIGTGIWAVKALTNSRFETWQFAADADIQVAGFFTPPPGWTAADFELHWYGETTAAGDVAWRLDIGTLPAEGASTVLSTASRAIVTGTPVTGRLRCVSQLGRSAAVVADREVYFRIVRVGTDTGDTYTGTAHVFKVVAKKVA